MENKKLTPHQKNILNALKTLKSECTKHKLDCETCMLSKYEYGNLYCITEDSPRKWDPWGVIKNADR